MLKSFTALKLSKANRPQIEHDQTWLHPKKWTLESDPTPPRRKSTPKLSREFITQTWTPSDREWLDTWFDPNKYRKSHQTRDYPKSWIKPISYNLAQDQLFIWPNFQTNFDDLNWFLHDQPKMVKISFKKFATILL